jgi:hypothetical protein
MAGPVPAISMKRARHFNMRSAQRGALLIEITGTSPVMTSAGASISPEHALGMRLSPRRMPLN